MNLRFLIVLAYYNRPKMVHNALRSLKELEYPNFEVVFIDDGSAEGKELLPILKESRDEMGYEWKYVYIPDTPDQKIQQGGSRFGDFLNKAVLESNADIVVLLCDDDALIKDSLFNLNKWFVENPNEVYCYSHVRIFDPLSESPFYLEKRPHWTNREGRIAPAFAVDSSQVAYRARCFKEDGLRFAFPQTKNLDASIYNEFYKKYGDCPFTGFDVQYKAYHAKQLGLKSEVAQYHLDIDI